MAEIKTIFTSDTSGLNAGISNATRGVGNLASSLGKMMAGGAALGYVKNLIEAQSAIKDQSDAIGVSTRMLQGMREMGKEVGVSFENIQTTLNKLDAARIDAIKDSGSAAGKAFTALGLSGEKLAGMNTEQTIIAVAEAFSRSGKGATEYAAMLDIVGIKNARILPVFDELGKGSEDAFNRMAAEGRIASEQTIDDMDKLGDKLGEIGGIMGNFVSKGVSVFIQGVEDLAGVAGHLSAGGVTGMEAIDLVAKTRSDEANRKTKVRKKASDAILSSQSALLGSEPPKGLKAISYGGGMTDSLLRMGGGTGRDVSNQQLTVLQSINNGITQLVTKDTAPKLR